MNHEDLEITLDKELEEMILLEAVKDKVDDELNIDTTLNEEDDEKILPKKKKRKKFSSKKLKSALTVRTILILVLTLIVNTYAWFIYLSTASLGLNVHVQSWQFDFSFEDQDKTNSTILIAEDIYPGMKSMEKSIVAENKGETAASLSYSVSYIRIFDDVLLDEGDETVNPEKFKTILEQYPFDIKLNMNLDGVESTDDTTSTQPLIVNGGQKAKVNFLVSWEYERGNSEEEKNKNNENDTKIGRDAYKYYHPKDENGVERELTEEEQEKRKTAIEIKISIEAVQIKEENKE